MEEVKILNSECKIADFKNTIANNVIGDFNGTIYGYDNSTTQHMPRNIAETLYHWEKHPKKKCPQVI